MEAESVWGRVRTRSWYAPTSRREPALTACYLDLPVAFPFPFLIGLFALDSIAGPHASSPLVLVLGFRCHCHSFSLWSLHDGSDYGCSSVPTLILGLRCLVFSFPFCSLRLGLQYGPSASSSSSPLLRSGMFLVYVRNQQ